MRDSYRVGRICNEAAEDHFFLWFNNGHCPRAGCSDPGIQLFQADQGERDFTTSRPAKPLRRRHWRADEGAE
jgi:hypothetical protein